MQPACRRGRGFRSPVFPLSAFCGQQRVALKRASLFLPVIEIGAMIGSDCAAGPFGLFGDRLAVIFENHPDIGQITRETGWQLTAPTTKQNQAVTMLANQNGPFQFEESRRMAAISYANL